MKAHFTRIYWCRWRGGKKKRRKGKFMLTITIFHLELLLRRKLFRANLESVSFSFAIVNKFMSFSRKAFKWETFKLIQLFKIADWSTLATRFFCIKNKLNLNCRLFIVDEQWKASFGSKVSTLNYLQSRGSLVVQSSIVHGKSAMLFVLCLFETKRHPFRYVLKRIAFNIVSRLERGKWKGKLSHCDYSSALRQVIILSMIRFVNAF